MDNLVKIDKILKCVLKPTRYLGNELNSIHKDHGRCLVKIALAFPDVYEIGMSHLGLKILYKILNDIPYVVAERVYAPWKDLAVIMEKEGIPLFSLETKTPIKDFDILGFTLQYELSYTNILYMLRLADIPLRVRDRSSGPLIVAGGPCAANPEPLADFIDIFCIGDGEGFIVDLVLGFIENRGCRRDKLLQRLSQIPGAYVPSLYDVDYDRENRFMAIRPKDDKAPYPIQRRLEEDLNSLNFPVDQIVPFMKIIHDRATLEIQRGCSQGCRFCQAGMIYRPVRKRSLRCLKEEAERLVLQTGYEEVSFLSLSVIDYDEIEDLASWFMSKFGERKVALSLPSLRVDRSCQTLLDLLLKVKKTGLTFAPEAGTLRLRNVINKKFLEEDLLGMIEASFRSGWNLIKLYFMIGLPTEKEEDIEGIVKLVSRIKGVTSRGKRLKVSISPFVPKSHTPFQWDAQLVVKELYERVRYLRDRLSRIKGVELSWHQIEASFLEAVFARGDRRLGKVLFVAYTKGCRFDSWTDEFRFNLWKEAFSETRIDPTFYANRKIEYDEPLPWDHICMGIKKEYLIKERELAYKEETTPDCRDGPCRGCGACTLDYKRTLNTRKRDERVILKQIERKIERKIDTNQRFRVRIEFTKGEEVKYISHLDMMTTLARAIRRANIPIAFSKGYHPKPRLAFGPALKVGIKSLSEYADLELNSLMDLKDLKESINRCLPPGIRIRDAIQILPMARSLSSIINLSTYHVKIRGNTSLDERIRLIDERMRESIRHIRVVRGDEGFKLEISLMIQDGKAKIDEVLEALFPSCEILDIERIAQYHLDKDVEISPMEIIN